MVISANAALYDLAAKHGVIIEDGILPRGVNGFLARLNNGYISVASSFLPPEERIAVHAENIGYRLALYRRLDDPVLYARSWAADYFPLSRRSIVSSVGASALYGAKEE